MPHFEHDGARLAFDDTAEAGLAPVVLIHGLSGARTTWDRITPSLRGRFRLLTVDLRGHGESSHAPGTYTLDHYTPDVIAFCEQVVGAPSVVVGHSLGGVIAADLARRRPDLVVAELLEDPPLYVADRSDSSDPDADRGPIASLFPMLRQLLRDMHGRQAPIDDYVAMMRAAPSLSGRGTMADVLGEAGTRAHALAWSALDPEIFTPAIDGSALATPLIDAPLGPMQVVVVRADPALGAAFREADEARFQLTNPGARVVLFEGASHAVQDEQPERFAAELGGVLDSVARL
jgi:pimeloyl-ACP methyl ester carboxylesterase